MQSFERLIKFDEVSFKRGRSWILKSITINLTSRRIGLIGNNGSGKSSFARLINGLFKADSGEISVYGVNAKDDRKSLSLIVGFIFQNPDHQIIFPTVGEELVFGLSQVNSDRKVAEKKARLLLDEHKLSDWFERPVHQLSNGERHLVCILAVVIMDPKVIIFDESLSSLDFPTRRKLLKKIKELDQQIVMISHDFECFKDFDRLIWLERGEIRMEGKPSDVIKAYKQDTLLQEKTSL